MQEDIVETIKQKIRLEDIVEADGYTLPKRGRYRKCPGHGGLVIDTHDQRWYHNQSGEWGDVIAWVEREKKTDFKGAVEWLAGKAGLPRVEWGRQDPEVRRLVHVRETTLNVAMRVMAKWLHGNADAMAYCQRRGWTTQAESEEGDGSTAGTVELAWLGYSGSGTDAEKAEMRRELKAARIDLASPVAVAILGLQGVDVQKWARANSLEDLSQDWIASGYVPGIIGHHRLVYPHMRSGRVVYLSARSILEKRHYNLPEVLVGKRQVYINHEFNNRSNEVVIVEGQADAISLGQLGISALALNGVAPGDVSEIIHKRNVYIGLDADEAGKKNALRVADQLKDPLCRIVEWPSELTYTDETGPHDVKDANDLLRSLASGTEDEQREFVALLLRKARTYVEVVAGQVGESQGVERDDALRTAIAVISQLDEMGIAQHRSGLAKAMGLGVRDLANLIKTYTEKSKKGELETGEPVYTWGGYVDGYLIEYLYDQVKHESTLAWRTPEGKVESGRAVVIDGRQYQAYPPNNELKNWAVLFPSKLGDKRSIRELVTYLEMYLKDSYLMPSERMTRLIAYYILLTWQYDSFETIIYLRAMGSAGSGKSEFMRRVGLVCYRTMQANGAGSSSSLFRALERYRGTVYIDEADMRESDAENDVVKFYNLGAMRNNPIWRTVETIGPNGQKDWEAVSFQTFCPKLVAMRKEFRDDAVGSRSLTFKFTSREMLELKAAGIPLSITGAMRERAQALRNLLVRWRLETWQPEVEIDPEMYDMLISPRLNQVAGPLLAIASDDPQQQEDIRQNLREYYAESILSKSMTITARVIEALWKIYKFPDLRAAMLKVEPDGAELIKVGDITRITNEIMDQMNETGDEDDDDKKKKNDGVKSRRIGNILRDELQLKLTERRRDGFFVFWNGPRIEGLSVKYGVKPEEIGPEKPIPGNTPAPAALAGTRNDMVQGEI